MSGRLLLIDDEPNLLRAVAACLRAEGYEVATARTAAHALTHLAETVPDLIISDVRMPGMDGYELLRHIRTCPQTSLIPVVFLTAKDQRADRTAGFRAGVDAYVTKPFEPDELVAIVSNILARVRRTHTAIARLVRATGDSGASPHDLDDLTEAEIRIARSVARGLSNKRIATELGLSIRTVENHISHILAKKGFDNRVEIARHVMATDRDPSGESGDS
jgi:DNA-binding NarL/FixJ family response regulator